MNSKDLNPFTPIYEQLDRIESSLFELRRHIDASRDKETFSMGNIDLAIKVTGYSKFTIYKMVSQREIPHFKHRGRLRFDENDLVEWMKGNNHQSDEAIAFRRNSRRQVKK